MRTFAVIGSKGSGKTTTIETLVKGLTERGYRIATVKHVSEPNFTIDTFGKDSMRHSRAGAKTVVVIAPKELTIIKKLDTTSLSLQEIVGNCPSDTDFLFFEGFGSFVKLKPDVPKIIAVKAVSEALNALKRFRPITAFTGPAALEVEGLRIPTVDVLKNPRKLVEIILSA